MHTMHPTLRIGSADWNPAHLPRGEFEGRIAQLWVDHPDAGGAIVYGDPHDHSALSYLTHFTPKLEASLALIPREGAIRLLVGGGPNMVPAARPLTFIEDLQALTRDGGCGRMGASFARRHRACRDRRQRDAIWLSSGLGARVA